MPKTPERFDLEAVGPSSPLGAVRVFVRKEEGEDALCIVADADPRPDGEFYDVWWYDTEEVATDVARFIRRMLSGPGFTTRDGFTRFPLAKIPNLMTTARNHLFTPKPQRGGTRKQWTAIRAARLGFLAGLGYDAKRIAADRLIASTPNNVHQQAHRFGIALSGTYDDPVSVRLPAAVGHTYDRVGAREGLNRHGMVRRIVLHVGARPELIDAILAS